MPIWVDNTSLPFSSSSQKVEPLLNSTHYLTFPSDSPNPSLNDLLYSKFTVCLTLALVSLQPLATWAVYYLVIMNLRHLIFTRLQDMVKKQATDTTLYRNHPPIKTKTKTKTKTRNEDQTNHTQKEASHCRAYCQADFRRKDSPSESSHPAMRMVNG